MPEDVREALELVGLSRAHGDRPPYQRNDYIGWITAGRTRRRATGHPGRGSVNEGGVRVGIRPWSAGDLPLLERLLGDPAMMEHLGGPDTPEAIRARHERYLGFDGASEGVFAIVVGPDEAPAGWIGYWATSWRDEDVWECGWHVLPEHQARGVATAAAVLAIEHARARGRYPSMHAFPAVGNVASNALCRGLGFASLGEVDVEYPVGHMMHSNDWCLDLLGERRT